MSKTSAKSLSKSFITALLRGLAVFAVFGMALYAYAITYPAQPNAVSGVVGLYVGKTTVTTGNVGGYVVANNLCQAVDVDSHICTAMEMANTYNHNPTGSLSSETGSLWINNGPPGYITNVVNDCAGWTTDYPATFGTVWDVDQDASFITSCDLPRSFACCK